MDIRTALHTILDAAPPTERSLLISRIKDPAHIWVQGAYYQPSTGGTCLLGGLLPITLLMSLEIRGNLSVTGILDYLKLPRLYTSFSLAVQAFDTLIGHEEMNSDDVHTILLTHLMEYEMGQTMEQASCELSTPTPEPFSHGSAESTRESLSLMTS